jgi:hypothetical protein
MILMNHGVPMAIRLHGRNHYQPWKFPWLMVIHGFRQLSNLMLGPESNPASGIFIFYFFNISCKAEAQNHPSVKILTKKFSVIFLSHF